MNFVDKQNEDIFTKLGECARNVAKENCKTFKENSQTTFQIAENELQMYKKLEFEKCFLPEREQQSEVLEELYTCAEEVDPCNQLIDAARKSGESLADYQDRYDMFLNYLFKLIMPMCNTQTPCFAFQWC